MILAAVVIGNCLIGVVVVVVVESCVTEELVEFSLDILLRAVAESLEVGVVVVEAGVGFLLISFLAVKVGPFAEAEAEADEAELKLPL